MKDTMILSLRTRSLDVQQRRKVRWMFNIYAMCQGREVGRWGEDCRYCLFVDESLIVSQTLVKPASNLWKALLKSKTLWLW